MNRTTMRTTLLACCLATCGTAIASCPPCPADLSGDGAIDGADLGFLLAAWNTADAAADLDESGTVDGADLGALLAGWGGCPLIVACPVADHGCFSAGDAGCDDEGCCSTICDLDQYCCLLAWDGVCVEQAILQCGTAAECCLESNEPGCPEQGCEALVCGTEPSCCAATWDAACAEWATILCAFCSPITVSSASPDTVEEGDVVYILGSGFPADPSQICVMAHSPEGKVAALRALSSTGEYLVAQVVDVPDGFGSGQIQVTEGTGFNLTSNDLALPPNVELMAPGAWVWSNPQSAGRSGSCVQLSPGEGDGSISLQGGIQGGSLVIDVPSALAEAPDGVAGSTTIVVNIYGHVHPGMVTVLYIYIKGQGWVAILVQSSQEMNFCVQIVLVAQATLAGAPAPIEQLATALGETVWQLLSYNSLAPLLPPVVTMTDDGARITITPDGDGQFTSLPAFSISGEAVKP